MDAAAPPRRDPSDLLGPIRVRLAGLVLIAAIPLLLLCSAIAWQNYRLALDVSGQAVTRLRESALARHAAAIDGAQQMLQAIAQMPDLVAADQAQCDDRLSRVLDLQRHRYSNIKFFDAGGHLRCRAMSLPDGLSVRTAEANNRSLFEVARQSNALSLGNLRFSAIVNSTVIPAVYPVHHGGTLVGFLYTGLRMDWFGTSADTLDMPQPLLWLIDPNGTVTPIGRTGKAALPPPATLSQLLTGAQEIDAHAPSGKPYAYASSEVAGGYHLLVAYSAGADRHAARLVLLKRVLQLALFTVLGLAAVAIGTHNALVAPLNALGRKVGDWRRTGIFDNTPIPSAPLEVRALTKSFADATAVLTEQERKLDEAMEKQTLLMREIHHRVKNNLQIVASLLNLQASRIRAPGARAEFAAARDRVRALATLHRHLYSQGELTSIMMSSFLTELCGQLFDAMGERRGGRIQLTIEAIDLEMSGDQAVPLSLVVTEAVSNAIKYAFPGGRSGHVGVFLTSDGESARLVIEDDGVGIPAGRVETETGTRDGLGIQLIRGFAKQLKAELTVEEVNGTRYTLSIPLAPHAVGAESE
jgi:two-component sensor histidine kinase